MAKFKQWKISTMIKHLRDIKKEYGDLPMFAMSDEEGNQENILGEVGKYCSLGIDSDKPTKVTIWPFDNRN